MANEIKLFSKYKSSKGIHLKINNYNQNVVFFKTQEKDYPKFNQEICHIETPWQQGHGTCVRLKLSKPINFY